MFGLTATSVSRWRSFVLGLCILVLCVCGATAQVTVAVTFNPPSPVPIGNTTLTCDFTLAAGDSLGEQYWQIIGGSRFFTYRPGQNPEVTITPEYQAKVISYDTSNANSVSIVFDVTACDVEQYYCNVLGIPSATEGNDQQSLEVQNFALPVLKTNDTVWDSGEVIVDADTTVSCHLNNAGPPLPEQLAVLIDGAAVDTTAGYEQDNVTCMWDYLLPAQTVITPGDVTTDNKIAQCRVTYRDSGTRNSAQVTLVSDPCVSDPCQNGGTCSSEIDGSGNAVFSCACLCATSGDMCQTSDCDSNPCGNYGTCSIDNCDVNCTCDEGVSGDKCELAGCLDNQCSDNSTCVPSETDYKCDCHGDNIFGELCNTTGCMNGTCSCESGGTCVDELDKCYCQCPPGCAGPSCETFEEGDLCETSCSKENRVSCSQTCDSYNCMCKQGFTGLNCTTPCTLELSDATTESDVFILNVTDTMTLRCDADNATNVTWWNDAGLLSAGVNYTFVATNATVFDVFCRVETPVCVGAVNYTFVVQTPNIELEEGGNTVNGETVTSGGTIQLEIGTGGDLQLNASIKLTQPLPTLLIVKEDNVVQVSDATSKMTSRASRARTVLSESDTGSVGYYDDYFNASDAGSYIALAQLLDYEEVLYTVELVSEGTGGDDDEGFPVWAIVVICIAVLLVAGLILGIVFRDKIKNQFNRDDKPKSPAANNPRNPVESSDERAKPKPFALSTQTGNSDSDSSRSFKNSVEPQRERSLTRESRPPPPPFNPEAAETPRQKRKKKKSRRRNAPDVPQEHQSRPLPVPAPRRNAPDEKVYIPEYDSPEYQSRPLPVPTSRRLPPIQGQERIENNHFYGNQYSD